MRLTRHASRAAIALITALAMWAAIPALAASSAYEVYYHQGCSYSGSHTQGEKFIAKSTNINSSCDLVQAYGRAGGVTGIGPWASYQSKVTMAFSSHDYSQHRAKEGIYTDSWNYLS